MARPVGAVKGLLTQAVRRALDPAQRAGHQTGMIIYKIFQATEWAELDRCGTTAGAPIDLVDGYVHFSTAEQAAETAAKHFTGQEGLMLLGVDTDRLGDKLKWETSRNDQLFPHLYRELRIEDVVWARALPLVDGVHQFPVDPDETLPE